MHRMNLPPMGGDGDTHYQPTSIATLFLGDSPHNCVFFSQEPNVEIGYDMRVWRGKYLTGILGLV